MSEKGKIPAQQQLKKHPGGVAQPSGPRPKKLLDPVREAFRTEQTYIDWIKRCIIFHEQEYTRDPGAVKIRESIAHLATDRKVTTSTQNQALSAILFLYCTVLQKEIDLSPDPTNPARQR